MKMVHSIPANCGVSGLQCTSGTTPAKHIRTGHTIISTSYQCDICKRVLPTKSGLKNHVITHGKRLYACQQCSMRFHAKGNLTRHAIVHQPDEKNFACQECCKRFKSKLGLDGHLRRHDGVRPYGCEECDMFFVTLSERSNHSLVHHADHRPSYSCTLCKKCFKQRTTLIQHVSRAHTREKLFKCHVCRKDFVSSKELKSHTTVHSNEKPFECVTCGRPFRARSTLFDHMKTHTGEKTFACTFCEKLFGSLANLKRHIRSHTGEKPYACPFTDCERSYSTSDQLPPHIRRVHTGEKLPACDICGKEFVTRGDMTVHKKIHNPIRERVPCDLCDKSFATTGSKDLHMRIHLNEKAYKCKFCDYASVNVTDVKRHEQSKHT